MAEYIGTYSTDIRCKVISGRRDARKEREGAFIETLVPTRESRRRPPATEGKTQTGKARPCHMGCDPGPCPPSGAAGKGKKRAVGTGRELSRPANQAGAKDKTGWIDRRVLCRSASRLA